MTLSTFLRALTPCAALLALCSVAQAQETGASDGAHETAQEGSKSKDGPEAASDSQDDKSSKAKSDEVAGEDAAPKTKGDPAERAARRAARAAANRAKFDKDGDGTLDEAEKAEMRAYFASLGDRTKAAGDTPSAGTEAGADKPEPKTEPAPKSEPKPEPKPAHMHRFDVDSNGELDVFEQEALDEYIAARRARDEDAPDAEGAPGTGRARTKRAQTRGAQAKGTPKAGASKAEAQSAKAKRNDAAKRQPVEASAKRPAAARSKAKRGAARGQDDAKPKGAAKTPNLKRASKASGEGDAVAMLDRFDANGNGQLEMDELRKIRTFYAAGKKAASRGSAAGRRGAGKNAGGRDGAPNASSKGARAGGQTSKAGAMTPNKAQLKRFDKDESGALEGAERAAFRKFLTQRRGSGDGAADAKGAGATDAEGTAPEAAAKEKGRPTPGAARLGDGAELPTPTAAQLKRYDLNGDGQLRGKEIVAFRRHLDKAAASTQDAPARDGAKSQGRSKKAKPKGGDRGSAQKRER